MIRCVKKQKRLDTTQCRRGRSVARMLKTRNTKISAVPFAFSRRDRGTTFSRATPFEREINRRYKKDARVCVLSSLPLLRPSSHSTASSNMALNATLTAFNSFNSETWSGYVQEAQTRLPSRERMALLGFINLPIIIIVLNALWQKVCILFLVLLKFAECAFI